MKRFPQAFTLEDNQRVILAFEELLRKKGFRIPAGSPLEKACLSIFQMLEIYRNKGVHDLKIDCRADWREAFSLADIARKILKAKDHPDFHKLLSHVRLLLEQTTFSQFSAVSNSASPAEKDTNNKTFELFVAAILVQFCSNLQFDSPKKSKGNNPDAIGDFLGTRWAFACKALHSGNPRTCLDRVRDAVGQIEKTKAIDRGIVILNLKNLIPHDQIWPAKQNEQTGDWEYGAYQDRGAPSEIVRHCFRVYEQGVYGAVGGREAFVQVFRDTKVVPMVLLFFCTVTSVNRKPGVIQPTIIKQLTGMGLPQEQLDPEAGRMIDAFNDHLHDRLTDN